MQLVCLLFSERGTGAASLLNKVQRFSENISALASGLQAGLLLFAYLKFVLQYLSVKRTYVAFEHRKLEASGIGTGLNANCGVSQLFQLFGGLLGLLLNLLRINGEKLICQSGTSGRDSDGQEHRVGAANGATHGLNTARGLRGKARHGTELRRYELKTGA